MRSGATLDHPDCGDGRWTGRVSLGCGGLLRLGDQIVVGELSDGQGRHSFSIARRFSELDDDTRLTIDGPDVSRRHSKCVLPRPLRLRPRM